MANNNQLEAWEEFTVEADNLDQANKALSTILESRGLDVIQSEFCRTEHRDDLQSKYYFDIQHYIGPKQQRRRFDPRSV